MWPHRVNCKWKTIENYFLGWSHFIFSCWQFIVSYCCDILCVHIKKFNCMDYQKFYEEKKYFSTVHDLQLVLLVKWSPEMKIKEEEDHTNLPQLLVVSTSTCMLQDHIKLWTVLISKLFPCWASVLAEINFYSAMIILRRRKSEKIFFEN